MAKNFQRNKLNMAEMRASAVLECLFYSDHKTIREQVPYIELRNAVEELKEVVLEDEDLAFAMVIENSSISSYTVAHCINVCILSIILANIAGYDETEVTEVGISALLHDIGKRLIGREIVLKQGPLTDNEMQWIKTHPILGAMILTQIYPNISEKILHGVLYHHERLDGRGYPNSIKEVPEYAMIIAVVDVFEAYIAKRPYHEQRTVAQGIAFLINQEGLDETLLEYFLYKVSGFTEEADAI